MRIENVSHTGIIMRKKTVNLSKEFSDEDEEMVESVEGNTDESGEEFFFAQFKKCGECGKDILCGVDSEPPEDCSHHS